MPTHQYRYKEYPIVNDGWYYNRSGQYGLYIEDGLVVDWDGWEDGSYAWAGVYSVGTYSYPNYDVTMRGYSWGSLFTHWQRTSVSSASEITRTLSDGTTFRLNSSAPLMQQLDGAIRLTTLSYTSWQTYSSTSPSNYNTVTIYQYDTSTGKATGVSYTGKLYYRNPLTFENGTDLTDTTYYWQYSISLSDGTTQTFYIYEGLTYTKFTVTPGSGWGSAVTDASSSYFFANCNAIYADSSLISTVNGKYRLNFTGADKRLYSVVPYITNTSTAGTAISAAGKVIRIKNMDTGSGTASMVFCNGYLTNDNCLTL